MFKILIFAVVIATPVTGFACPQPMPVKGADIEVDDFDLGTCWLKDTLQSLTKKGKAVSDADGDLLNHLLAEMVGYIPSVAQKQALATILVNQVNRKSAAPLRTAALGALGNLHVTTPDVRAYILDALQDKDAQMRATAILAASEIDPKDPGMQKAIIQALLNDADTTNRDAALDGIYLRSDEAINAIKSVAKSGKDKYLQGDAQAKLDDWQAHPLPATPSSKSMAVLGDSISVGFFADTTVLDAPKYKVTPNELNVLWFLGQSKHDDQMSRVWAHGDKISSHYDHIKNQLKLFGKPNDIEVYNIARAGATTPALITQIVTLEAKMLLEPDQKLIYVTLFMGSNDVCGGIGPDIIAKNLKRSLDRLNRLQTNSKIVVLLSSLPPIYQLGSPAIANFPGVAGLTCQQVQRDHLKFCNPFTAVASSADYEANKTIIETTNEKIADVADLAKGDENLQVVFGSSVSKVDLSPEFLAIDCFHPNQQGQQALSDILWNDIEEAGVQW